MVDFCAAGQRLKMPIAKIRGVDEVESAGSGFSLASKRPKILFEGHLFYAELRRKGLHIKAQMIDPTICYPKWTKAHYIGRDGEYARLAKATEICHALGVTDGIALRCASWGRYQILGSNFIACGYDSVEQMVEAMFLDEDNHLEAFCEYIVNTGIDDELRRGDIIGFVRRYNGPLYARNNYHIKLPRAIERFEKQKVNCREIEGQVVAAMPGLRDPNPAAEGFANTGFDERYLKSFDAEDENTGLVPNPFKEYQAEQASATASVTDGDPGPAAVNPQLPTSPPQDAPQSLPATNQEPPPPADKVAVEKEDLPVDPGESYFKRKWRQISAWWTGIGGLSAVKENSDTINQVTPDGFKIDPAFMFWVIAIVIVLFLLWYVGGYINEKWVRPLRARWLTTSLIKANTTPTNNVIVASADKLAELEKQGYIIVTRG